MSAHHGKTQRVRLYVMHQAVGGGDEPALVGHKPLHWIDIDTLRASLAIMGFHAVVAPERAGFVE